MMATPTPTPWEAWFVACCWGSSEENVRSAVEMAGAFSWYPKYKSTRGPVSVSPYVYVRHSAPLSNSVWYAARQAPGFSSWLGGEVPTALPLGGRIDEWLSQAKEVPRISGAGKESLDHVVDLVALSGRAGTSAMALQLGWGTGHWVTVDNRASPWYGYSGMCGEMDDVDRTADVHFEGLLGGSNAVRFPVKDLASLSGEPSPGRSAGRAPRDNNRRKSRGGERVRRRTSDHAGSPPV